MLIRHSVARRGLLASLAIVVVSCSACGGRDPEAVAVTTSAPPVPGASGNWNFERGDLTAWGTSSSGSGAWHVYADGTKPPDPKATDPNVPFKVPRPPEGRFGAVTDTSAPGLRILYRDVQLDGNVKLRLTFFYENHARGFSSPASFDYQPRKPNQQFRVELMDPAAPVDSLAARHVLAEIFRTAPDDRRKVDPRTITFDLSRWAGTKVRIRFAQVDNQGPLRAGVDDVRLEAVGP